MGIDSSIAMGVQVPQIADPLNKMAQVLQVQGLQNQNSLFPLQLAQQQLANQRAQQQWQMIAPILQRMGSGQPAPGAAPNALSAAGGDGSTGSPASPSAPNALTRTLTGSNPQGIPTDDGIPYSLSDLAALSAAGYPGAKEMLEVKKAAMQGVAFEPGKTYNVGGQVFTVPQLDKGMVTGPDGVVRALPGYSATNAGIQGDQAAAVKGKELLPLDYKTPDGRPIGGTQGEYLGAPQPGAAPPQAAPAPAPVAYQPPTVTPTGQPVPPQVQQMLTGVAQSRDPAKLQQFASQIGGQIDALPEGPQKQAAQQSLQSEIGKIQQSWQASPAAPAAPPPAQGGNLSGRPQLQSATEAAQAAAAVKQQTEPNLGYSTKAAEALQTEAGSINSQLADAQGLMQRIAQSREAMKKFQAGGGMDTRVDLAKLAQVIPGMPKSVVDAIAGGDLSAAQEFQKYAAQEALETMRQALANDTGKASQGNRIAMQLFIKNNPNIDTDPNAIERIFNFQTQLHNELLNKSNMITKYIQDPASVKDPAIFNNMYANSQIASGNVNPQMVLGQGKGTVPAPAAAPAAPTNAQTKAVVVNGQTMQAMRAPDGNFYVKQPNGKYAVVRD